MIKKINIAYLLIGLIFLAVPVLIFWIYLTFSRPERDIGTPTPTVVPTETAPSPTIPVQKETIRVLRSFPVQNPDLYYLPIQPVELMFTGIVNPQNLKYEVEPFVKTEVKQGKAPNSLIISPVTFWEEGTIKITITSETRANDGRVLYPPFEFFLNIAEPPGP